MFETGYMNFFNVDQCGLYRVGKKQNFGCSLSETFQLIQEWVEGRRLTSTIPWDPTEARRNKPKCYCKDIYKDEETGDYLVVLWKSETDGAGTLWGAKEDNQTGSSAVVKYTNKYNGDKLIWGRPCYYWVIPEHDVIISIKFDHSVCDALMFEDYVTACITNRVKHKNRVVEHTQLGHARISYVSEDNAKYLYRFNTSLKSLNTSTSELKVLADKVTHIIRRETIVVDSKDERTEWVKKFAALRFVSAKPKAKQRRIEVKWEAKPTVEEIREIIEENAKEQRKAKDWDNVGFETDSGVTWVDKYRLRDVIVFSGAGDSIFTAQELYKKIIDNRDRYIGPIIRTNKIAKKSSMVQRP